MSLRGFHVLFISAAVILALGLGFWCARNGNPVGAGASVLVALGLIAYETWFLRKTGKLT